MSGGSYRRLSGFNDQSGVTDDVADDGIKSRDGNSHVGMVAVEPKTPQEPLGAPTE